MSASDAKAAVFVSSSGSGSSYLKQKVQGYDWNTGINYEQILKSYLTTGFQATNFGLAVQEINNMLECRKQPMPKKTYIDDIEDPFVTVRSNCTIFLGYTSNIISSGLRETIKFLVQHKLVDAIVSTAGGVEEDLIKCLASTYLGEFHLDGKALRKDGINRIGNLLVPNDNYCKFESWINPLLNEMLAEQKENNIVWSPSKIITRLGERIDNEESVCYWAAKNKIPIFSPALTDGSLGDTIFFHSFKNPGLVVDIASDIRRLNLMAMKAINTGILVIGGGVVKHHINNANLMRNGTDYAVYINTASEFDGSDSGANPDEAVSWGKIKLDANPVKICAEATLILPLLVAETFAKYHFTK